MQKASNWVNFWYKEVSREINPLFFKFLPTDQLTDWMDG